MVNKIYLYLKGEEELGDIIEKIRKFKEKEIILVVPVATKALLHPVNLEIFKKEIEKMGKNIYIDTEDEKLNNLCRHFQIPIFLTEDLEKPIIDIKPPQKITKLKNYEERKLSSVSRSKININFFGLFKYFLSLVFVLGIFFVIWYFFDVKAEIYIETEKNPVEFEEVITLKENILNPDYDEKILPAKYEFVEINKTETATTTGKVFSDEKPLLKVVFFNYLERDIPLLLGTRLSFQDNIFRTTEKIVIPAAKNQEPGKYSTTAFLDSLKNANLKISRGEILSIVALEGRKTDNGLNWSDVLKAQVEEDYDISSVKSIGSVSSEDITNIKIALENSLKSMIQSALSLKYPNNFYYFDPSLVKIEIINVSHRVGEKTDKISAMGKATYETMLVNQKDLDEFLRNLVNQRILNENKNLVVKDLNYNKINLLDFNSKQKTMILGISIKAILLPDLNPDNLKNAIKGQNLSFVQDYFSKLEGVSKVRIKIFPQWKEKLPQDLNKIKISIN